MKRTLIFGVLILSTAFLGTKAVAFPPGLKGDVIRTWNNLALQAVRTANASDAQAARLYAMVNDAVNGMAGSAGIRDSALAPPRTPVAAGDSRAAAAGAAHDVLVALFPAQLAAADAQLAADVAASLPSLGALGRTWGGQVAAAVLAARSNDGSTPAESQPAGTGPGQFPSSWSGVQFRNLKPFAIASSAPYVSAGPPPLDSLDYAAAFAEVKLLGNAAIPDAGKSATFTYWSVGNNSSQPPGAWLQVAQTVSAARSLSLEDTARLFALESMAMADTVAPTYMTKFVYRFWRPTTAIRQADTDNNPNTVADPAWSARAGSVGSSPEHWSGHSSFSASAASVLAGFFCRDRIPFSLVTDTAPGGQARSYPSFSAAANEAGLSRVVGGLHFNFSNQAGLTAGRDVAAEVLSSKLLLTRGATHPGECPL